jgi:hypothetical protein
MCFLAAHPRVATLDGTFFKEFGHLFGMDGMNRHGFH